MEVSDIAEIIRKEKSSNFLQELGENFYEELKELVENTFSSYPEYSKERENLKKLIDELINIREKKLLNLALSIVREKKKTNSIEEIENITDNEKETLKEIIKSLEKNRKIFEGILSGKAEIKATETIKKRETKTEAKIEAKPEQKIAEAKSKEEHGKKEKMLAIRMLADLPPIMGIDRNVYGPFKKEDVVFMPEKNARIFIEKKYAVEIK